MASGARPEHARRRELISCNWEAQCARIGHCLNRSNVVVQNPDMPEYELVFDRSRLDVEAIHAFLSKTYWSPGIPRHIVQRAIDNSVCFGVLLEGRQVAFARLVTDKATFAYLADVYVLAEHRGRGLSRRMLEAIQAHPDLQGLRRMMLATRDAHDLYAKFGFKPLAAPERMMEIHVPNAYNGS